MIHALCVLWVRPLVSVRCSSVYVMHMGVWGCSGGQGGQKGGQKVLMGNMCHSRTVGWVTGISGVHYVHGGLGAQWKAARAKGRLEGLDG